MKRRLLIQLLIIAIMVIIVTTIYLIYYKAEFQTTDINLLKTQQMIPWGVKSVNAPVLWTETTGKGVKVAIMDSGIDFQHPDLGSSINQGYNAIDPSTLPNDDYGHGTLVGGIIAAKNNSIGVVGVAPDTKIYPVKVLDKYGEGDIADIERGIDWCIENQIQIINMSFSIEDDKPLLKSSIEKALDAGIIVVASASNSFGGKVGFPASYENVISVTSVDEKMKLGENSPRGKIDFCAPGVKILSTSNDGSYEEFSGNSLATPHVTGLIALLLENPKKYGLPEGKRNIQLNVYQILKSLSLNLGEKGKENFYGEGFITMSNIK